MKKIMAFAMGLAVLTGLSVTAFADQIQGSVQSINNATNEIVVKDGASGKDKTVIVHPKILLTLHPGSLVKIALKSGSNAADTVEVQIV